MSAGTTGARDQVGRLLKLVPLLHAQGPLRVDDAARLLGVEPRQIVNDLRVLFMCGLPGGYPDDLIDVDIDAFDRDGDGVIRVSNADYLARPMRLSATEATALIVALRALRDGADRDTVPVIDRVLGKLEVAASEGNAAQRVALETRPEEEQALSRLLADAIAADHQVELSYYVPARDEESTRVVDPRALVTEDGYAYLAAYCHSAQAPRTFRLDRIHHARELESPIATQPEPGELAATMFTQRQGDLVTLRLAPRASWVPDYHPVEAVRRQPDGSLEIDLRAGDPMWVRRLLLRLAPDAEVVSPTELAEEFHADVAAALARYAEPHGTGA